VIGDIAMSVTSVMSVIRYLHSYARVSTIHDF